MLPTAAAGLGLGLSLIVAIGAQNAFVLRQGIRREHVGAVVAICAASDVVLIMAGVGGAGLLFTKFPSLIIVIRYAGAVFLVTYGVLAARRMLRPAALEADMSARHTALAATALTCLALTWLNPHVYLDTVALLGSIANTYGAGRWWFALGACVASIGWFAGLGFGARLLRPIFARPIAWRILDGLVALTMFVLGLLLVLG